jgi:hypothetical protein
MVYENMQFTPAEKDTLLPLKFVDKGAYPCFSRLGRELYFSGQDEEKDDYSRDIYFSRLEEGVWTKPELAFGVNSVKYDSYPVVSPDGAYMVLVSDRPEGMGGKDLWIAFREDTNRWTIPINLGEKINTVGDETTPYIDMNDNLYFASNRTGGTGGFDIYKINIKRPDSEPELLPYPINTKFDEMGCTIFEGEIYLASNRDGGCGEYDLYSYSICGPALISGKISAKNPLVSMEGTLMVVDLMTGANEIVNVDASGNFMTMLTPLHSYKMKYQNPCVKDMIGEKRFSVPCSDTSVVNIVANINVEANPPEFDFTRYEIPFFSTGYYMPLTNENMQSLKQKFAYNLIGNTANTKYIDYPDEKYTNEIPKVELALHDAADYLYTLINEYSNGCKAFGINQINVKVIGYADPRPLSSSSAYVDADVYEYGLNIKNGEKIDNKKLSELRAYYTAKQIQEYLMDITGYTDITNIVNWEIEGQGIDKRKKRSLDEKRRVAIEISVR